MQVDAQRREAYLAAYDLFEAVQGERRQAAMAALPAAREASETQSWPEVGFVLSAADTVHALSRSEDHEQTIRDATTLVAEAEALAAPALLAVALGLRAIAASSTGDTSSLMTDASRALALLDNEEQPALDRCTGYVVVAAAFNTLRLWELVDELYTRASDLEHECQVPVQAAAIAINRVITRFEWALALLENDDEDGAQFRLAQAASAIEVARAEQLPPLWSRDVEAFDVIIRLLRGEDPEPLLPVLTQHCGNLAEAGDIEVLPLLAASTALALWRHGQRGAAVSAAEELTLPSSASSGARSFPLWARAHVLAGDLKSPALQAQRDHAAMLGHLRWESRQAVLSAARAQIAAERRRDEHDRLSEAVNTDPLTGMSNRRPFDAWLNRPSLVRARSTALLLVDLDDFKAINDTHGHDCGDEVLRRFARLVLTCVRPGDLAVRLGGDEFAVLLEDENLTLGAARLRGEGLRRAVRDEQWSTVAPGLSLTVSVGMAVCVVGAGPSGGGRAQPSTLYRGADAALYAAKQDEDGLVIAELS